MRNSQVTKFLILFVFVFLCSCDLFKSMCEAEKPPKQSTTLQQIVNDTNAGETIDLEKYSNEYDITDYNAEISKNLTIKNGSFQNTTLKIKAEVKLEKVQELSVETSANLTIRDSKLNNLLLGTNAESRSTNSGNTNFDLKVIVKNCEIAEKIKINSKAKLNIAGEKTKIAKIVVAVAAEVCKILCTTEVDTKKIENVITDENGKKPEEIKITQAYKITYHSNCDELENIEDFFSPDDETISLPTDIFKRNGYIFAGWYYDNNQAVEDSINVSGKTENIDVYAKWESTAVNKIAGIYKLLNESATIEIKNDGTFVVTVTISGEDGYMNGNWKKANEENYEFIFDDNTAGTATSIEEDVIKMVYKNENEGMDIDSYAVKISNENVDLSGTWIDENSIIIIKEDTFTATLKDGSSKNGNIEKIGNFFKLETFARGAISASKQALYIDPYGKEITPSVYTKSTTNEESFEDLGGTGVYKYELKIEDLVFEWGGGFSVLLLTDEQLEVCNDAKDFKQATAEKPEYQIAAFSDMIVEDTTKEGNFAVYGRDNKSQHYDGVAVTIKDNTFTLFIDMTKLTKTQLKGLWKGTDAGNEPIITEDDTVNLTGYKPYVIALTTQDKDVNNFKFRAWDADLMAMTAGATFPTNLQQSAPTTGNTNSVTVTNISVNSTNHKTSYYVGEELDLTRLPIIEVKRSNGTTETLQPTSEMITGFDSSTAGTKTLTITYGGCTTTFNIEVKELTATADSVTVTDNNNNTETINFSELSTKLSTLSAGTYTLKVSGAITSATITAIATAMNSNTEAKINLDLSGANGVTTIGDYAFSNCSSLTSIEIPNSVTTIGTYAFFNCPSLTSVKIPDNVIEIKENAFEHCTALNSVTIGNGVTSIGASAFSYCSGLTSIEIPDNVIEIKENAFEHCTALNSVTIGNGVTSIGANAFSHCSGLTNITIGNKVTSIGDYAFLDCSSLTSVTIPNNVTTIGVSAFSYCENLTSVTIGNGVTSIGASAFSFCSGLTSIEIPNSVTSIGASAFSGCSELTIFKVATDNQYYSSLENEKILYSKDQKTLIAYPSAEGDFTIPNSVTSIADGAFRYCSNLTNVTIPDSVTSIGDYAFSDCLSLTSVTIGNGVTTIGFSAFSFCSGLTSVKIPDNVIEIKENTFMHCTALNSVTIGNGVTTIGFSAFYYCENLTSVTIPNSVTTIGDYAFSGCSGLTSVTFKDTNGWYYNDDSGNKITINVTDNTGGNATYLREIYSGYSWYKESSTGGTAN